MSSRIAGRLLLLSCACFWAAGSSVRANLPSAAAEKPSAASPGEGHGAGHGEGHGAGHGAGHGEGHGAGHGGGHSHGDMPHRFERAADWVKKFEGPERDAWQKPQTIVSALGEISGKTVVDLGAGTGYFLPHLSRAVGPAGQVLAVDVEADMVRHMQARAGREGLKNVRAQKGESDDPKLAPSSADRVLIVDVWHHIPARGEFAKKLAAALRPGGAIHIVDFKLDSPRGPPKKHKLTPESVIADLKAGGLVAELLKIDLPDQYVVVARQKAATP